MATSVYDPIIPELAVIFKTSIDWMNFTVTAYLIFLGICEYMCSTLYRRTMLTPVKSLAPIIWAPLSDIKGRRPIYLGMPLSNDYPWVY